MDSSYRSLRGVRREVITRYDLPVIILAAMVVGAAIMLVAVLTTGSGGGDNPFPAGLIPQVSPVAVAPTVAWWETPRPIYLVTLEPTDTPLPKWTKVPYVTPTPETDCNAPATPGGVCQAYYPTATNVPAEVVNGTMVPFCPTPLPSPTIDPTYVPGTRCVRGR
jgi:hypothetical protein